MEYLQPYIEVSMLAPPTRCYLDVMIYCRVSQCSKKRATIFPIVLYVFVWISTISEKNLAGSRRRIFEEEK
jgi:hypothetical protein